MDAEGFPLVSVITCFLNQERFLKEAVESVLSQEYSNWQLVLVDDGSTDNSTTIALEYAARYPEKILYIEHPGHANNGLSASRNLGLQYSGAELITFLDGDDVWLPGRLSQQMEIWRLYPEAGMILEATEYWNDWDDPNKSNRIVQVGAASGRLYLPTQLITILYPLGTGSAPSMCGLLVKKALVLKHGGFEDSFRGMYEDQAFLIKMYLHESVYISSLCNNRYRQRPDSLVHTSHESGLYYSHRKRFLEWMEGYLRQQQPRFVKVERLLWKTLLPYRRPLWYRAKNRGIRILNKIYRTIFTP